jgi:hypothetical protein
MLTVHKYSITPDTTRVETHEGAEPLTVGVQGANAVLWMRVDPDRPKQYRWINVVGTGFAESDGEYIGMFMLAGGRLVFHVFDRGPG